MSPRSRIPVRLRSARRQAGVGIVTAIFLLVVLAGLGTAMVSLYLAQQSSSNVDLLGARAYQAARAGMEWGLFRQTRANSCAPSTRLVLPAGTTLSGFTVVVRCAASGTGSLVHATITSSACNLTDSDGNCNCDAGASASCVPSTNPDTVNRRVEVQL
jgi:MSHA biogenesis protein MshP